MMAQVSTSVHNEASAMTVSIHSWQVYCNSCYLQSLSHNGGAVSGAQVLQNSRFLPWQSMQSHRLNSQARSPAAGGCQGCQDQSIYCTVVLTNTVTVGVAGTLRLVGTGIGGVLGYLVMLRTGLATRCAPSSSPVQGRHRQPLCTFASPCFCFFWLGESWDH